MIDDRVFLAFRTLGTGDMLRSVRSLLPSAIPAIFQAAFGQFLKKDDDTWLGFVNVGPEVAVDFAKYVLSNSAMPMTCSVIAAADTLTKIPKGAFHSRHTKALFRQAAVFMRGAEPQDVIVFNPAVRDEPFKVETHVEKPEDAFARHIADVFGGRLEPSGLKQPEIDAFGEVISRLYKKPAAMELFGAHALTFESPTAASASMGVLESGIILGGARGRGSGEPPSDDPPRRSAPPEPPEPPHDEQEDERRINVWIEERRKNRDRPLILDDPYTLSCNVGAAREDSLTGGADVAVRPGDVPPGGLRTEWVLSSDSIELEALDDTVRVETGGGKSPWWSASFELLIPEKGTSGTRSLRIRSRTGENARVDFAVFALRDGASSRLYRRFSIRLEVEERGETIPLRNDHVAVAARDLLDGEPLDWDAGTSLLTVTPIGRIAVLNGEIDGEPVRETVEWRVTSGNIVSGLIDSVRNAAERLRVEFEEDLNAIDREELVQRLASFTPLSSASAAAEVSGDARARLDRILASRHAFELADAGYALYSEMFETGSKLRQRVDSLEPGARLIIPWPEADAAVAGIPWGLMYYDAPKEGAIRPEAFLSLRFRITYDAYPLRHPIRALGTPQDSILGFGIYWGDAEDAIGDEAAWQRSQWASPRHMILPPDGQPARESVVRWFGSPDPATPIMYFYCKTGVVEKETALLFSGSDGVIRQADLGAAEFASRPLVFANACATSGGDPYVSNAIEQRFFRRGCRAYIGTECRVPIRLASRVAHVFLHLFERKADPRPVPAGEALFQTRLFLLRNFGNLGGIFYSVINLAGVCLASKEELSRRAS